MDKKKILEEIVELKMMKPQTQEIKKRIQKLQQQIDSDETIYKK